MKKFFVAFLFFTFSANIQAQHKTKKENLETIEFKIDSTSVLTLDSTIKTLYAVISGEKGQKRNWKQFKFLFYPDAKLIPSGKDIEGNFGIRYMSPNDYVESSGNWLVENGFFEKEVHRKIDTFGFITHVFSTYESFYNETDKNPFMRGINSIQLVNDGKRWWIVNVFWTNETEDNPIPKAYLPK
jgi:hypothetical protein